MFASFNPSVFLDRGQIAQIKVQATLSACSLDIMINSLDSRMSNLDYTLGIISNVISQTAGGIQTQDFYTRENTSPSAIFITLNKVYPYIEAGDYLNTGRYAMLLATTLLNFQSPSVEA